MVEAESALPIVLEQEGCTPSRVARRLGACNSDLYVLYLDLLNTRPLWDVCTEKRAKDALRKWRAVCVARRVALGKGSLYLRRSLLHPRSNSWRRRLHHEDDPIILV